MNNARMAVDERLSSWKVLLPCAQGSCVLILGGSVCLVQSFCRSFERVDWSVDRQNYDLDAHSKVGPSLLSKRVHFLASLDGNTTTYDIVVIADKKWLSSSVFKIIDTLLKPDGVLVQVGLSFRPWNRKILAGHGLGNYLFLSALPVHAPRLFFPLLPAEFCQSSLSFHMPGSRKVRFSISLLKLAARCGITMPLKRRGIVFSSREKMKNRLGSLAVWLSEKLSLQIDNMAIYCGSESPRRKMTLLVEAVGSKEPVLLVAKVADTETGADAIRQESTILRYLERCDVECEYPRLLFEGDWNSHLVQVQQAFSPKLDSAGGVLRDEHLNVLASFSQIERKTVAVINTREWLKIAESYQGSVKQHLPAELQSLWKYYLIDRANQGNIFVPVHLVHGDFASWNMRWCNGRLAIFDWEDSFLNGLPFYDLFRFVYRQASLVGPWPGGEKLYTLLVDKACFLSSKANYNTSLFGLVMPLLLMYEYLERPHPHLLEVANCFLEVHE